jgi:hypothetical protein
MTTFVIVAALMAALAAAVVTVPLWRERQSRWLGVIAGVLVAAAAAGLYPLWSNWSWHSSGQAQPTGPDVAAMVAKLEAHMRDEPKDMRGWLMLGRSYVALERLDDAILAYDHAHQLDAGNVDATLGLAEAMSLRAGGNITPEASQLFEQAVKSAPDNPKALLYGGFAAAERGDKLTARSRWQALKDMHPPPQIEQLLDARIAELGLPAAAGATPASGPSNRRRHHRLGPGIEGEIDRRSAAVRVCARTRRSGTAAGSKTLDNSGHGHPNTSFRRRLDDARTSSSQRSAGHHYRPRVIQWSAPAGGGRFIRRTYL